MHFWADELGPWLRSTSNLVNSRILACSWVIYYVHGIDMHILCMHSIGLTDPPRKRWRSTRGKTVSADTDTSEGRAQWKDLAPGQRMGPLHT